MLNSFAFGDDIGLTLRAPSFFLPAGSPLDFDEKTDLRISRKAHHDLSDSRLLLFLCFTTCWSCPDRMPSRSLRRVKNTWMCWNMDPCIMHVEYNIINVYVHAHKNMYLTHHSVPNKVLIHPPRTGQGPHCTNSSYFTCRSAGASRR